MKTTRVTVDRFEGARKRLAVLLTDGGAQVVVPRALLPKGTRAGDVLSWTLQRDAEATQRLTRETEAVQEELKATDPGGDVTL